MQNRRHKYTTARFESDRWRVRRQKKMLVRYRHRERARDLYDYSRSTWRSQRMKTRRGIARIVKAACRARETPCSMRHCQIRCYRRRRNIDPSVLYLSESCEQTHSHVLPAITKSRTFYFHAGNSLYQQNCCFVASPALCDNQVSSDLIHDSI